MAKPDAVGAKGDWLAQAARVAQGIRRRVLEHTIKNNGGYLSQACSSAELLAALYVKGMRLAPSVAPAVPLPFAGVPGPSNPGAFTGAGYNGPKSPELDRFFFSPVHYALVLYATLIEVGRLSREGLGAFNKDGSTVELIGAEHSPGHEVTAGSLAQCVSQAAGVAMARKLKGETGRTWVFMSDGEFEEGQTWEAMNVAAYHKLGNLRIVVDANAQQCDGAMASVGTIEPFMDRLRAFGVEAVEVNGHDLDAIGQAMEHDSKGVPLVIVARTHPCQGIPLMEARRPKIHYIRFKTPQELAAYQDLLNQWRAQL